MKYITYIVLLLSLMGCENKVEENKLSINKFHEIAESERKSYIINFIKGYKDFSSDKEGKSIMELLVRPNNMSWPEPYAQIRLDMMSNLNGEVIADRIEQTDPAKTFKPFSFKVKDSMLVDLSPFVWNRVEVRCIHTPSSIEPLTKWANKWMDLEDKNPIDSNGLSGVVHSVTYPSANNSFWYFMVDFGSAPVAAFDEFLDALNEMGINNVTIGSFSPIK